MKAYMPQEMQVIGESRFTKPLLRALIPVNKTDVLEAPRVLVIQTATLDGASALICIRRLAVDMLCVTNVLASISGGQLVGSRSKRYLVFRYELAFILDVCQPNAHCTFGDFLTLS
jgi:hypothetical protein